ncbi:hypothetical protein ACQKO6_09470 [Pseudomonas monteilii]
MEENLIAALKESISNSQKIKSLILHNIEAADKKVIRLNLVYLTFDFSSKTILLEYFVEDDEYPNIEMSFSDLAALLKSK